MHFTIARILRYYLRPDDLFSIKTQNKSITENQLVSTTAVLTAECQSAHEGGTNKTNASFEYSAEYPLSFRNSRNN